MIILLFAQAICALSLPLQKIVLNYSAPLFLAGFRMVLAGTISLTYARFAYPELHINSTQLKCYFRGILSGGYIKYVLKAWAVSIIPANRVALLCSVSPFCTVLFSYHWAQERVTLVQLMGMAIGWLGIFFILCDSIVVTTYWLSWLPYSCADFAILAAVVAHCHGSMITRTAIKEFEHAPSVVSGIRMLGGGILVLFTSLLIEGLNPVSQWLPFLAGVLFLVIISNLIGHWLYVASYHYYSPTLISFSDSFSPFFVSLFSWFLIAQAITISYLVSTLIVSIGLSLFYYHEQIRSLLKKYLMRPVNPYLN